MSGRSPSGQLQEPGPNKRTVAASSCSLAAACGQYAAAAWPVAANKAQFGQNRKWAKPRQHPTRVLSSQLAGARNGDLATAHAPETRLGPASPHPGRSTLRKSLGVSGRWDKHFQSKWGGTSNFKVKWFVGASSNSRHAVACFPTRASCMRFRWRRLSTYGIRYFPESRPDIGLRSAQADSID